MCEISELKTTFFVKVFTLRKLTAAQQFEPKKKANFFKSIILIERKGSK